MIIWYIVVWCLCNWPLSGLVSARLVVRADWPLSKLTFSCTCYFSWLWHATVQITAPSFLTPVNSESDSILLFANASSFDQYNSNVQDLFAPQESQRLLFFCFFNAAFSPEQLETILDVKWLLQHREGFLRGFYKFSMIRVLDSWTEIQVLRLCDVLELRLMEGDTGWRMNRLAYNELRI